MGCMIPHPEPYAVVGVYKSRLRFTEQLKVCVVGSAGVARRMAPKETQDLGGRRHS